MNHMFFFRPFMPKTVFIQNVAYETTFAMSFCRNKHPELCAIVVWLGFFCTFKETSKFEDQLTLVWCRFNQIWKRSNYVKWVEATITRID